MGNYTKPYGRKFRAKMVQRMSGPGRESATALSRKVGVPQGTLSRWLREAGRVAEKVLVKQDVDLSVQNAQIESAGVKIDPAVMLMLLGIEAHGSPPGLDVSAYSTWCLPTSG